MGVEKKDKGVSVKRIMASLEKENGRREHDVGWKKSRSIVEYDVE